MTGAGESLRRTRQLRGDQLRHEADVREQSPPGGPPEERESAYRAMLLGDRHADLELELGVQHALEFQADRMSLQSLESQEKFMQKFSKKCSMQKILVHYN